MNSTRYQIAILAAVVILLATAAAASAGSGMPTMPWLPANPGQPWQPQGPGPGCPPGKPGHPGHDYAIMGVITAIEEADGSALLITIDRGAADDNPDDDVQVLVTDETHIMPPGQELKIGLHVRAMVKGNEEPFTAYRLMVGEDWGPGHGHGHHGPRRACGTIAELPEEGLVGTWKIQVHHGDEYEILVTADTKITPPDVEPEVGWMVCFSGHETDEGWVADHVQLSHGFGPGPGARHQFVIRGAVVGEPANDPNNEWTLTIDVFGGGTQEVLVRPETQIMGELVEGAQVVVHAWKTDDGQLVARAIMVTGSHHPGHGRGPGHMPGPGHGQGRRAVHFEGLVIEVTEVDAGEQWTIVPEEEESLQVLVTDDTALIGFGDGGPLGQEVEGVAIHDADGNLVARMIRLK